MVRHLSFSRVDLGSSHLPLFPSATCRASSGTDAPACLVACTRSECFSMNMSAFTSPGTVVVLCHLCTNDHCCASRGAVPQPRGTTPTCAGVPWYCGSVSAGLYFGEVGLLPYNLFYSCHSMLCSSYIIEGRHRKPAHTRQPAARQCRCSRILPKYTVLNRHYVEKRAWFSFWQFGCVRCTRCAFAVCSVRSYRTGKPRIPRLLRHIPVGVSACCRSGSSSASDAEKPQH